MDTVDDGGGVGIIGPGQLMSEGLEFPEEVEEALKEVGDINGNVFLEVNKLSAITFNTDLTLGYKNNCAT